MQTLRIYLLGNVDLYADDTRLGGFATKKSKALFAYLVLGKGKLYPRELLADAFWRGLPEARARRALSTDLWRIGSLLKEAGLDPDAYLVSDCESVGFNADAPHWLDVDAFRAATGRIDAVEPSAADRRLIDAVSEAVTLYRGDLLEGVYDDWCLAERDRLQARHLSALEFLMQANMARGHWSAALSIGQKILAIDPFMEHVQRSVMRCHFSLGNRPAAVRQYATCARLLRQELDVDPMEETRRTLETIVAAPASDRRLDLDDGDAPVTGFRSVESKLHEITLAIASIDAARTCLLNAERQLRERSEGAVKC